LNRYFVVLAILLIACFIPTSAALSDTDAAIVKLALFSVLDDTGHFNYVKTDVGWDDTIKIWYVPKATDNEAAITTLGEILGAYIGMCRSHPEISDLSIMVGTEDNVAGELYCERSWISTGQMSDQEAGALILKVMGTFEKTS